MMRYRLSLIIFLFGSLVACTPRSTDIPNQIHSSPSPQASPSASVTQPPQTTTIQVEGDPQKIAIEPVQTPYFSTSFPSDRFALQRGGGSGEGEGTWFYWKQPDGTLNKNAYVQVFFPATNQTVSQIRQFLMGERGIFAANNWQKVNRGSGDSYAEIAYSAWLRDLILFRPRTNPQNIVGTAYIGEIEGRAFYAIAYYPREYGDGFTPRADVILKNLKGKTGVNLSSDRSTRSSQLGLKGIGTIQVGMTVEQAGKALREPLIPQGEREPGTTCRYVAPRQSLEGLKLMVIDDRIARMDVRNSTQITTLSGAKIGDSEARIQQLYAGQIEVTPHKYVQNGHYLTFTPKDAQDQNYRLIFETDGKQVTEFRSGRLPEVAWVEGCS